MCIKKNVCFEKKIVVIVHFTNTTNHKIVCHDHALECLQLLVQAGAVPKDSIRSEEMGGFGESYIHMAAKKNNAHIIQFLYGEGWDISRR